MKILKDLQCTFLILLAAVFFAVPSVNAQSKDKDKSNDNEMIKKLQEMAPARGYLKAHRGLDSPRDILGGALNIDLTQDGGPVFVILPGERDLDPVVFGTPEHPMKFAGSPGMTGVPPMARNVSGGKFTSTKEKTPFSNKYVTMKDAKLTVHAVDRTATDAAATKDELGFEASWKDDSGNTYSVKCDKLISAGLEYPTFGGVVTNVIMHGFTGIGTPLMPSEYAFFAFWGMGSVSKNGKVLDDKRIVHGMLTEYVRKNGYKLAFDDEVKPDAMQFHLMVPPAVPDKDKGVYEKKAVKTGFEMEGGKELPFWHVMFENVKVEAARK